MAKQARYMFIAVRVLGRGAADEKFETEVQALSIGSAFKKGMAEKPEWFDTSVGSVTVEVFSMEPRF